MLAANEQAFAKYGNLVDEVQITTDVSLLTDVWIKLLKPVFCKCAVMRSCCLSTRLPGCCFECRNFGNAQLPKFLHVSDRSEFCPLMMTFDVYRS
jgi:hypothetical protein